MTVSVPDEMRALLDDSNDPDTEVRALLAAHFYAGAKLGVGKAAELAGMKRSEFEEWLRRKGVPMPWTRDDLDRELLDMEVFAAQ